MTDVAQVPGWFSYSIHNERTGRNDLEPQAFRRHDHIPREVVPIKNVTDDGDKQHDQCPPRTYYQKKKKIIG